MALIKCLECKKEISDKAKICPNCGMALKKKSNIILPLLLGIITPILIISFFLQSESESEFDYRIDKSDNSTSKERKKSNSISKTEAAYSAQKFVEKQLKAPSTAKFPSLNKANIKKSNDVYEVSSYVDSQNGFGAMIRSNYTVKISRKDNGNITLLDIKID
ncbi:hypothetical protein K8354_15790 [Polaribacter litorisediminis]|uniref:zinc ribbon domain-containing protein n=1 Tax=Polaribacter litorisediminis TaxID=1908341 RepID=UPI001CBB86D1|nr:zinc ribbon domain-containing protein [Polaribacter litorisediminis]UAM97739.1 hypothetical protein K8354_15790 [Polaribacter litorisediminis]